MLIRIAKYVQVVDALNVKLPIDLIKTFVFRFVNQDITRKIEFANVNINEYLYLIRLN